jgi:predicted dehydrogenase
VTIRVSILGVGSMGKNHLRVLSMLNSVAITNIFDTNEAELKLLSDRFNVPYTTDIDKALLDIDAVVIVTPTSTHYHYIKLCIGKVSNIFVEKPLAETYAQALEIKKLSDKHDFLIQCGFIERFNPVVAELKKIIKNSTIINIDFFRTNRLSNRVTDVDVVLDLMIHDIDLALYLNGPIHKVAAFGSKEDGLIGFASAIFQHDNGSVSRLIASRMTEKKMRSIQATTADAYIDADLLRRDLLVHQQSSVSRDTDDAYVVSSSTQQVEVKPREALVEELQAFISICNGNIESKVPDLAAGIEAQRISNLVIEGIKNA